IRTMLLPSTGQYILPVPTFDDQGVAATPVPTARSTQPVTGTVSAPTTPAAARPTPTPTRRP
ncbi:MAG: hypothetical protein KGJ80_18600, partial [Chloroflexota bacterium]|nr:hypothetical protein [Chloroflexota bacterium]